MATPARYNLPESVAHERRVLARTLGPRPSGLLTRLWREPDLNRRWRASRPAVVVGRFSFAPSFRWRKSAEAR